jgi:hypothetical protein
MKPPHADPLRTCSKPRTWVFAALAAIGVAFALGAVTRAASPVAPSLAAAKSYTTSGGPHQPIIGGARGASPVAPSFAAAKGYATGADPGQPVIADLNGDGKPDLATADSLKAKVSVLLNRGDGSFEPRHDYATGHSVAAAAADLNGDGAPDLVGWTSNTVSVLLNRGDGSFEPRHDYAIAAGAGAVAIADLNGDDKPDLAFASPKAVSVLLNRRDGSFEPRRDYAIAGFEYAPFPHLEPIDLNGDGRPELVSWTTSRDPIGGAPTVSVFLNRGDGSFEPRHDYTTGGLNSLAITDLNGDDRPDLATATWSSHVSVFLNRGDGSFAPRHDYPTSGPTFSLATADLNGDGSPDIALSGGYSRVSVLLNNGDGTFGPRHDYRGGGTEVEIADLNGDGKPDLAAGSVDQVAPGDNCRQSVSVFLNRGNGTFGRQRSWVAGLGGCDYLPRLSDLNGDGRPDLVHGIRVRINRGDGSFGRRLGYPGWPGSAQLSEEDGREVADLSGDGRPDVAVAGRGAVWVRLNTPGLCNVQNVRRLTLSEAKAKLALVNCRVGKVSRAYSKARKGRVISEKPVFGTVLPGRGKVNLVVSRGRQR